MANGVPVRFHTTEERRQWINSVKGEEGMTYEELIVALLRFREEHRELWESQDRAARRASGSSASGNK